MIYLSKGGGAVPIRTIHGSAPGVQEFVPPLLLVIGVQEFVLPLLLVIGVQEFIQTV